MIDRHVHRLLVPCIAFALLASPIAFAGSRDPETNDRRWAREVRRLGVDPERIENPVRFTTEMQDVAREVGGGGRSLEKLRRLQALLFDPEEFPFDYQSRETYTAERAFELRTGNCVSFTNLFIALARSLGIDVRAALLNRPGDPAREGALIVVNTHIVAAFEHSGGATVFDFNVQRQTDRVGLTLVPDSVVTAVYLNNLGAEALIDGRVDDALELLGDAVRLGPEFTPAHGNLGVARRQAGDLEGAMAAYRGALEIDPRYPTILNNLARLYRHVGRDDEARTVLAAARNWSATPFVLLIRGDFALIDGDVRGALTLYRQASRLAPQLVEPWIAIARGEAVRGHDAAARRALDKAVELDPDHEEVRALQVRIGSATDSR